MFSRKTRVVLDTNTLLLPATGVDIFTGIRKAVDEPYTLCTYDTVLFELENLMKGKKKTSFAAKLGYILAKQKDLKILRGLQGEHVDDTFVRKALKKDIVVTQDKELRKRLAEHGIRTLRYAQKHFRG